jgi:GntR family transcriptional regulator
MSPAGSRKGSGGGKSAKRSLRELPNGSLTTQAREAILNAVLANEFESRLPTEDELSEMLNVSRTTVRAAVQDLEREGLIKRRRAIGTTINAHVTPATLALQRLVGFDWLLSEQGHKVKVETSWQRETPASPPADLPWDPIPECCVLDKRYYADGKLAIALRDYVPWSELRVFKLPKEPPPSLFEFSRLYCEEAITHAIVAIVPEKAGDTTDTQLDIPDSTAFIRLHETHYTDQARSVAWSYIDVDDSALRFEVYRGES